MSGPVNIPTMDELLKDPAKVASLPPEAAQTLLIGWVSLQPVLIQRALMGTHNGQGATTPIQWLTPQEVAKRLGVKPSLVYELARAGKLKSCKLGKYRRFNEAAVQAYIESQEVDSARIRGG